MNQSTDESKKMWLLVAVLVLVLAGGVAAGFYMNSQRGNQDTTSENRGDDQQQDREQNETGYIGLEEQEALDKAQREDIKARVVERDGESLTITMDLVIGRHNFYVRDGKVYKVEVEGENIDTSRPD